uniref:DUF4134 domain-containing protein n=1 Tax=Prevotella sp. GTC17254 TaxID=3236794 RepID=A0AB33J3D7_9BACT
MNQTLSVIGSGVRAFGLSAVKKIKSLVTDPRFVAVMLLLVVVTVAADAQNIDSGVQAITKSTDALKKYLPVVIKLCYALAGIIAILGAISVYIKMNNEEQDVKKSIMMIVGACIFLVAAAQALPLFFGL